MRRAAGAQPFLIGLVILMAASLGHPARAQYTKLYRFTNKTGVSQTSVKAITNGLESITSQYSIPSGWNPATLGTVLISGVYNSSIAFHGTAVASNATVTVGWTTADNSCRLRDLRWGSGIAIVPTQLGGVPGGGMMFYDWPNPGQLTVVITNDTEGPLDLTGVEYATSAFALDLTQIASLASRNLVELHVSAINEDIAVIRAEVVYYDSIGKLPSPSVTSLTGKLDRAVSYNNQGVTAYLAGNQTNALYLWGQAAKYIGSFISEVTNSSKKGNLDEFLYKRWIVDGDGEITPAPQIGDAIKALPKGGALQSLPPLPSNVSLPPGSGLDPSKYVPWPVTVLNPGQYTAFVVDDAVPGGGFIMRGSVVDTGGTVVNASGTNYLDWIEQSVVENFTADQESPTDTSVVIDGGDTYTNKTDVTLSLHAKDNIGIASYEVTDASGTWFGTVNPSQSSFSQDVAAKISAGNGVKTVSLRYCDVAGNWSESCTDDITLDRNDVTINQAATQPDPAFKAPVEFTASFSEPVTGFTGEDIALSGTAGATEAEVIDSGDHKTFAVRVSGMTQSGTVIAEVAAGAAIDSNGVPSPASTSSDNLVAWDMKPRNVMLLPSSGTLITDAPITLRAQYLDPDGSADIKSCYTLISGDTRSWVGAVYLQYVSATNKVYIRNDDNLAWSPGFTPGTEATIENSQAKVFVESTKVARTGAYLTIDWSLQLKSPMVGRNLWGWSFVYDTLGGYDGWIKTGEYNSNLNLAVSGLSPRDGSLPIGIPRVFSTSNYDASGATDINRTYLLINDNIGQANAVYAVYQHATNRVYLRNDANTSWGTGYTPGSPVTLSNSQCDLDVAATNVTTPRPNTLNVNWAVTLKPSMSGKLLNVWTYVVDNTENIDPWKVMGVYYDQVGPVAAEFLPKDTIARGTPSVVAGSWSDPNGHGNLERCYLLLTAQMGNIRYLLSTAQSNACYVRYNTYENKIYLKSDDNVSWGTGYEPGTAATLSNSQVSIDVAASAVGHPDANTTRLDLMVTPTWAAGTPLAGWLQTRDSGGALSDWTPMTPQAPWTPLTVVP